MTERTQKTIDIFLDALNTDTLKATHCAACAVGNIIAKVQGVEPAVIKRSIEEETTLGLPPELSNWMHIFRTEADGTRFGRIYDQPESKLREAKWLAKTFEAIDKSGYTVQELMEIEHTFEISGTKKDTEGHNSKEDVLKRLNAVVKLLLEFDEDTETDVKEVFTSKAKAIAK